MVATSRYSRGFETYWMLQTWALRGYSVASDTTEIQVQSFPRQRELFAGVARKTKKVMHWSVEVAGCIVPLGCKAGAFDSRQNIANWVVQQTFGDNHSEGASTQQRVQGEPEQAAHNETADNLDCAYNRKTVPCAFQIDFDNCRVAVEPGFETDGSRNFGEAAKRAQMAEGEHIDSDTGFGWRHKTGSVSSWWPVGAPWAGNRCWTDRPELEPYLPYWDDEERRKSCCLHWRRTSGDRYRPWRG